MLYTKVDVQCDKLATDDHRQSILSIHLSCDGRRAVVKFSKPRVWDDVTDGNTAAFIPALIPIPQRNKIHGNKKSGYKNVPADHKENYNKCYNTLLQVLIFQQVYQHSIKASNLYLQCKGSTIICTVFCNIWLRYTSRQQHSINNSLDDRVNFREWNTTTTLSLVAVFWNYCRGHLKKKWTLANFLTASHTT